MPVSFSQTCSGPLPSAPRNARYVAVSTLRASQCCSLQSSQCCKEDLVESAKHLVYSAGIVNNFGEWPEVMIILSSGIGFARNKVSMQGMAPATPHPALHNINNVNTTLC